MYLDCLDRDNKRRTRAGAGTNTTMINSLVVANLMWTEDSKRILMDNRKKRNIPKDYVGNLECSILVKNSTVEALKELSNTDNSLTYDQIIMRLIRSYTGKNQYEKA